MKWIRKLYERVMQWSRHPRALVALAGVSFAESSFFPIPPDLMLISMGLAKPSKSWQFAAITTIASVVGGIFGYCIGYYGFETIKPLLISSGHFEQYLSIKNYFDLYGVSYVLIAGFTPIPYKIITIAAGAMHMPLWSFIVASIAARGARFYLVAGLLVWRGEALEKKIQQNIEFIGWGSLVITLIAYGVYQLCATV